jgi:hypothetical protein
MPSQDATGMVVVLGTKRRKIFDFLFWIYMAKKPEGDLTSDLLSKCLNMTLTYITLKMHFGCFCHWHSHCLKTEEP